MDAQVRRSGRPDSPPIKLIPKCNHKLTLGDILRPIVGIYFLT